jgi:Sigma-70 factor, region 1.1
MATKTAEAEDQEQPQAEPADGPVLDMSDAAVKKLIKTAKARGFVTYDELNEVLPSEEVSSEQIEDTMSMLSDMGINVIDTDEAEEPGAAAQAEEGESARPVVAAAPRRSGTHVSARDGLGRAALPRGRNRHCQTHRGRARGDDRRTMREPAYLPSHHHLARRAERGKNSAPRHH